MCLLRLLTVRETVATVPERCRSCFCSAGRQRGGRRAGFPTASRMGGFFVPGGGMESYEPQAIEEKWQQIWRDERAFNVANPPLDGPRNERKTYVLEMLPYPSGELHMGHVRNYMLGEVVAHFRRRHGYAVLRPMGFDSFGLPAENAAIDAGRHPRELTEENIARIRGQMERANEQVIDGHCERCGAEVEARNLEQWLFRITAYADRLLDEMELLESWPERVLTMQRNWIGRSEGAELIFRVDGLEIDIPVFTTRPDTLFGATFFVLAPEHPLVERLAAGTPQ